MGSFCTPAQTTSTYTPNYQATQQYQDILARANNVASTPYQAYQGQQVAGLDPTTNAGISNVNAAAGTAQPYLNTAANYASTGAAPVSNLTAQDINQYYSPYQNDVIKATQANINEDNAQQQNRLKGNLASSGALGGDRQAVLQSELARQQDLAANQTIAGLQNQGFNTAAGIAQGQQGNQQANAQRAAQAAYTFGNLGTTAQNAAISGGQAQIGAGQVAQGTNQAQLSAQYNNFLQQQAFPYQQTSWLAGVANPTAQGLGGTQTTTPPAPSLLGQLTGVGLVGAGLFGGSGGSSGGGGGGSYNYAPSPNGPNTYAPTFAGGGSVSSSPFDASGYFGDVGGYVPKVNIPAPQQHNFGTPPSSQSSNGGMGDLSSLVKLGTSLAPLLLSRGGSASPHGDLIHTIHSIRHGIRSRYADGGAIGGGNDDSLNPRNWLGWQSDSGASGTFEPYREPAPAPPSIDGGAPPMAYAPEAPFANPATPAAPSRISSIQPASAPAEGGGEPEGAEGGGGSGSPFNFSDETRRGLLSAGLGMLASPAHNPLQAIGEGGLKGVAAMDAYKKAKADEALKKEAQAMRQQHADVEARKLAQQAMQFDQTLAENTRQHDLQERRSERQFGAARVPPGFRVREDGGMEPIPGGPHDPAFVAAAAKAKLPSGEGIPEELRNVHGQEFLDALPPGEGDFIKKVANYEIDPKSLSTKGGHREDVFKKVAHFDDSFDQKQYNSIYNAVNKFNTGKQGDTIRSFNVGISHLGTLEDAIKALDNKDMNMYNRVANKIKNELGYPEPNSFDAVKDIVGKEIVKAVVGAGGGVEERRDAANYMNSAKSPRQLYDVINRYKELMGGQLTGLRQQFTSSTRLPPEKFDEKLLPETITHLSMRRGEPAVSGPPTGTIKDGYRFKGGDPSKQDSWEKVQ